MKADLILCNGKVITVDGAFRIASALAVKDGRLLAVGDDRDMEELRGPKTRTIDAGGRAVIPGLIDGHAHMDREGLKEIPPSLAGAKSVDEIVHRIAALAAKANPGEWIVTMPVGDPPDFMGVPESLAEKRYPNRHDLDRAAPDNPVYIRSIWGPWRHAFPLVSSANSRALALAGIGRDTPPPDDTVTIEKDAAGEPTSVFLDNNLYPLVEFTLMKVAPRFTTEQRVAGLKRSMAIYNSVGTTSVFEGHGIAAEVLQAYKALHARGEATVRAELVFSPSWKSVGDADPDDLLRTWANWLAGPGLGDSMLRMRGIYAAIAHGVAPDPRADLLPYVGWSGFYYDAYIPRDRVKAMMVAALRHDIRVVGITPTILPLYEEVDKVLPLRGRRWVLGHINILSDADVAACARMGLALTTHSNRYIVKESHKAAERLGPEAEHTIVPLKSLREAGIPINLATDNVPVSLFKPLWHAVARKNRDGAPVAAPGQRLSREDALRCLTNDGAMLTFEEGVKGSLEPRKFADFAVLSADPLTCPEDEIPLIESELTVVGGNVVFDRGNVARD